MNVYPLARNDGNDPVWWSLQGEAHLRGFQMAFVRLAGCDVNCPGCDTDYAAGVKILADDIAKWADRVTPAASGDRWVWITGGEPGMYDLRPLLMSLKRLRFSTAVASSGHHRIIPPVDWLSISPHDPAKWLQLYGNEVKVVPGLNGFSIEDFAARWQNDEVRFLYQYVQPLWDMDADREDPESLRECLSWLRHHPNWSLSRQNHKYWRAL